MSRPFLNKIIRFGINGLIMTIGSYLLMQLLLVFGILYIIASIISYVIMLCINYLTSSGFVFHSKKAFKNLINFVISQGISFLLFTTINYVLYTLGLDKNYCFLIAVIFSTTINFLYNNFITFRK